MLNETEQEVSIMGMTAPYLFGITWFNGRGTNLKKIAIWHLHRVVYGDFLMLV